MATNKQKKRALIITESHFGTMKESWVEPYLQKGYEVYLMKFTPDISIKIYDLIIVQWHENVKAQIKLLPIIISSLKNCLNKGGTVVHLFERTSKNTAAIINTAIKDASPAFMQNIFENNNKQYCSTSVMDSKKPFSNYTTFKAREHDFKDIQLFTERLNIGTIKEHSLLVEASKAEVHIKLRNEPVLLSKKIGNGLAIALSFGFCGSWNSEKLGLVEFRNIISEFIRDKKEITPPTNNEIEKDSFSENPFFIEYETIEALVENEKISETERMQIVKTRIGHSEFKKKLLLRDRKCRLCGIEDKRFLIASHIKPWSESNNKERIDVNNGLLLCPNHDSLFDKGFISFDDTGALLISRSINEHLKILLNLNTRLHIQINEKQKEYMKWHRELKFTN